MATRFDELAPRHVPALADQHGASLPQLSMLMQRLLAADGCPWDREQTLSTLKKYLRDEASEVMDAIDEGDAAHHCEELGDLLLQVVFQTELQRKSSQFGLDDVVEGIVEKLVRRHPHVFASVEVADADEVLTNWEAIKIEERKLRGEPARRVLDGVPRNLPALARAQKIGVKVAKVGFDWPSIDGSLAKVDEECTELREAVAAGDQRAIKDELGDALFALVNLARHLGVDAEEALKGTCDKFQRRFAYVEDAALTRGGFGPDSAGTAGREDLDVLDRDWNAAKALEKQAAAGDIR
jgi:MazG family protein